MPRYPTQTLSKKVKEIRPPEGLLVMKHPETGAVVKVDDRAKSLYESRGFVSTGQWTGELGVQTKQPYPCAVPADPNRGGTAREAEAKSAPPEAPAPAPAQPAAPADSKPADSKK